MSEKDREYKGFSTSKAVHLLLPVEALALLNRWAKLPNYFYHEDKDILYQIKDEKIAEWLKTGELLPTAIIVRESEAFVGMRRELQNNGANLDWLNWKDYNFYLTEKEEKYFSSLCELSEQSEDFGISIDYPTEIYQNWLKQLEPEFQAYQKAKEQYDTEFKRRQPILNAYSQSLQEYQQKKEIAAREWAKKNNIKIARTKSRKNLKKDWIKHLEKQGFYFDNPPKYPFADKLQPPRIPQKPPKSYIVNFKNYLLGSIPEVEEALNWAKSFYEIPEITSNINEDFICFEFEEALSQAILDRVKKDVLQIFAKVLESTLVDTREIWQELTNFEIDYSKAIGMNSYTNFSFNENSHRKFGKWHEINLSPTGFWLIEFQSKIEPNITFHLPYNKIYESYIPINLDKIPRVSTKQAKFGRAINSEEKAKYPLKNLLKILGFSRGDFPFELKQYRKISIDKIFEDYFDEEFDEWDFGYD